MNCIRITLSVDKEALKRIDEGAKINNRSRSNFMQTASDNLAKEVKNNE